VGNTTGWAPNLDKIQLDLNSGSTTSIEFNNISAETFIQVFPNPSTDQFEIETAGLQIEKLIVTDLLGRAVCIDPEAFSGTKTIHLDQMNKGVYLLNLKTASQWITKKLVIQ
jgi:hypothetical protein